MYESNKENPDSLAKNIFHSLDSPKKVEDSQIKHVGLFGENGGDGRVDFVGEAENVPAGVTRRNLEKNNYRLKDEAFLVVSKKPLAICRKTLNTDLGDCAYLKQSSVEAFQNLRIVVLSVRSANGSFKSS